MFAEGCSPDREVDIDMYFAAMHIFSYHEISERDKIYLKRVHQHMSCCLNCNSRYNSIKRFASADESMFRLFTPADFALLRLNEQELDRLMEID